jgi:hypothetical protein
MTTNNLETGRSIQQTQKTVKKPSNTTLNTSNTTTTTLKTTPNHVATLAHKNTTTHNPALNTSWADKVKISNFTTRAKITCFPQ